ncbi:MAG: entericidin A/B family lipoprotein [Oleiphilaceae bacterium]|nr:entericidin A/B family lipoprotein [Oleiphilaceae bacterium]
MRLVIQAFFLSLIFLVGLAGCNTMEGAGEDIEAGGEAIEEEAED